MVVFHSFLYVYQRVSQPAIEVGDISIHRMKLDESARPVEVGIETVFSLCLSWGFQLTPGWWYTYPSEKY